MVVILTVACTLLVLCPLNDMKKAYVEINGEDIQVVDYYLGIPKRKTYTFRDITSAEIVRGYSHHVKGYRISAAGTRYIVFRNERKYLFKILYLPETEQFFKQYFNNQIL